MPYFISIVCWPLFVYCLLRGLMTMYGGYAYNNDNLQQALDALQGFQRVYHWQKYMLVAVITGAYLASYHTGQF